MSDKELKAIEDEYYSLTDKMRDMNDDIMRLISKADKKQNEINEIKPRADELLIILRKEMNKHNQSHK